MCRNTISTLINLQKKNLESKLILQKYRANVVALYFLSPIFLYLVSENFNDTPKSWVEVGYDEADTTGMLVW